MVNMLDQAIAKIASLPDADQEDIGRRLLSHLEKLERVREKIDKGIMARPRRAVVWSPDARADLSDIWDYHAKSVGRRHADESVRGIGDATLVMEDHPRAGRATK
jgi:hypothetical protein